MNILRKVICHFGGHNLAPAAGPHAARCTFCDTCFAEFNDDHGAGSGPLPGAALLPPEASATGYEDEARVGAVN